MPNENLDEKNIDQQNDTIIVVSDENLAKNPLDIDTSKLSKKDLLNFNRSDLFSICEKKGAFPGGMKEYKKKRATIPDLVKYIQDSDKRSQKVPNDQEIKNQDQPQDNSDIILLQGAIIDILSKGDPKAFDAYCEQTLATSDTGLIDPELGLKIKKFISRFALVHLIIRRQFGGYKSIISKAKEKIQDLKNKKHQVNNEDNHGKK